MTTLQMIEIKGIEAIEALKRGDVLNKDQKECLNIYNQLHSKSAFNQCKRKVIKTGK